MRLEVTKEASHWQVDNLRVERSTCWFKTPHAAQKVQGKVFQIPQKIILPQADLKLHSSPQSRLYPGLELKVKLKFLFFSRVKTKLFDISSGGEYNLTWTVVSLAPVVQYHLQYRQIQVRKLFSMKNPSPGISLWRGGRVEEGGDARRPIAKVTNILFKNINTQNIEEMLDITTISPFGNLSPS